MSRRFFLLALVASLLSTIDRAAAAPAPVQRKPVVEVVFCLDTTGSMTGLIGGAKTKIWSICNLILNGRPNHAVREADMIYTDVWTSMGQEAERENRLRHFEGYQVNDKLLALAPAHARVMHCLPAHRGEEVTSEVLDSERSIVLQQAANRLHAQKALLLWLLGPQNRKRASEPKVRRRPRSR